MLSYKLFSEIIHYLHIIFILYICTIPFITNNIQLLSMHIMTCFLVLLHWSLNNDTCAMSQLEQYFRGVSKNESFIHAIVSPVYNYNINHETQILSLFLFILSSISIIKLYINRNELFKLISNIKKMIYSFLYQ